MWRTLPIPQDYRGPNGTLSLCPLPHQHVFLTSTSSSWPSSPYFIYRHGGLLLLLVMVRGVRHPWSAQFLAYLYDRRVPGCSSKQCENTSSLACSELQTLQCDGCKPACERCSCASSLHLLQSCGMLDLFCLPLRI